MGTATDYKEELINLTKELPESKLNELLDFGKFRENSGDSLLIYP